MIDSEIEMKKLVRSLLKYSQQKIGDPNFSRMSQMLCSLKTPAGGRL